MHYITRKFRKLGESYINEHLNLKLQLLMEYDMPNELLSEKRISKELA